jgi:hypothetical protein
MLMRSPRARRQATQAQQRWRANVRAGRRIAPTPVDALVLDWLELHHPGACDFDDLAAVGRLIGEILEASARAELL